MLVAFVAEHATLVLDNRKDSVATAAFSRGCETFLAGASTLGREVALRVLVGDCDGEPCALTVRRTQVSDLLATLHGYMRRKERAVPLTGAALIEAAAKDVPEPCDHGATRVVVCSAVGAGSTAGPTIGPDRRVVEHVAASDLAAAVLRHLEVAQFRISEVPLSTGESVAVDLALHLAHHALLCSPNPPIGAGWGRVSRACMGRSYRCAHLTRELNNGTGLFIVTSALKALPAGVGVELEGTPRRVLHFSERHNSLVCRCLSNDLDPGPDDELFACCNSPLPPELHRLYWGIDTFVESADTKWAGDLLQTMLVKRDLVSAWPQLSAAPVSRATAWRALWQLLAARTAWCPAMLPLSGFLPPDLRPSSTSPLRLDVPPDAVPIRGGALYAGLGLTSKPKFGGKDGE